MFPLFNSWGYGFQLELVLISWGLRICLRKCFKIFPLLLLEPHSFKYQLPCIFSFYVTAKDIGNPLAVFLKCRRKCLQILQHLKLYGLISSLQKQKLRSLTGENNLLCGSAAGISPLTGEPQLLVMAVSLFWSFC